MKSLIKYRLRVYAPSNQGGGLLIETSHTSEACMRTELAVCRDRAKRGEVGKVEMRDYVNPPWEKVL